MLQQTTMAQCSKANCSFFHNLYLLFYLLEFALYFSLLTAQSFLRIGIVQVSLSLFLWFFSSSKDKYKKKQNQRQTSHYTVIKINPSLANMQN